ncbi:helix-turn-helix domain-containing protein [Streptomyces sp. ACA25]|uniref:helix-turn-helix domain-containing protein n=1 Tax=Streptomyces sp. ACA25 TaxID=3022596 RepID=UPI003FA711B6
MTGVVSLVVGKCVAWVGWRGGGEVEWGSGGCRVDVGVVVAVTQPKQLDPYVSARAFYGAELRRMREEAGWSQAELGERVFCSGTYVGQFESAVRRPQLDLSRQFDEVLESGKHFLRLCKLARASKHPDYFADAAELEKLARTISAPDAGAGAVADGCVRAGVDAGDIAVGIGRRRSRSTSGLAWIGSNSLTAQHGRSCGQSCTRPCCGFRWVAPQ